MLLRFTHRRYRLPFRGAVNTAHGTWTEREGILLRVQSEGGGVGYGEVAPIPWFGTCPVDAAERYLASLEGSYEQPDLASIPPDFACVRGALAAAAEGARLDEWERFGTAWQQAGASAHPPTPPVLRKHAQVAALLPAGRAALDKARERAELGFRCFKWKVGVADAEDEMAMLDDLLAFLPEGSRLRLDANGAWDRRRAERWLALSADRPIEFVEQPIAPDAKGAEDLLLGLAGDFPVPVALDESLVGDADVERWIELGWNGVYVLKPALLGDVHGRLARLAHLKAQVVFSSALETRIGAVRLLRLALGWAGEPRALGSGVWPLFGDARLEGPTAAPFVTFDDILHLNEEETWNALN